MNWYKHRWPWLLMAGPLTVIVAGFYTGWLAFSHQDALVVGDYYKKGKAINQDLRRDRAASALGLAVTLRYDAAQGVLQGRVMAGSVSADAGGGAVGAATDSATGPAASTATGPAQALHAQTLTVRLLHATQPGHDLVLLARPDANGNFSLPLPMLERSRWQVLVESEKRDWRLEGEWLWPAEREVRVVSQQDTRAP